MAHFEQDPVNEERNEKHIESQCVCGNLRHIYSTHFFVPSSPLRAGSVEKGADKQIHWDSVKGVDGNESLSPSALLAVIGTPFLSTVKCQESSS